MNFSDARLAAEGLASYETWRAMRGMSPQNRWRTVLEAQGLTLDPAVELPHGDAWVPEENTTPSGEAP